LARRYSHANSADAAADRESTALNMGATPRRVERLRGIPLWIESRFQPRRAPAATEVAAQSSGSFLRHIRARERAARKGTGRGVGKESLC